MAAAQDHPVLTRVSLRQAPSLATFERYCEIYREVVDERPQLRGKLEAETRESLDGCQAAGLLFDIAVDGDWQGLIALRPDHMLGIEFLLMVDIVLAKPARGAGLGVGVHCALARIVAQDTPDAVFIGTIVPENEPSLLTARRAGRVEIGTYRRIVLT